MNRGPWAGGVFVGVLLIAAAYGSAWLPGGAPRWGAFAMIAGSALVLSCMLALGALRARTRTPRIVGAALFLFADVVLGFGAPLFMPEETANASLVLGLPVRAAIEIFGVGFLPFLVLPFVFASEFRTRDLDEEAIAKLVAECARLRALDASGAERA